MYLAVELTDKAIALDEHNEWARDLKIKIYRRLKRYDAALESVQEYIDYAQAKTYEEAAEQERTLAYLRAEYQRIVDLQN